MSALIGSRRLREYLDILVIGSGARIFGLGSQFVVLIMLSRFLSKDSFGDLMTAFGFYRLTGLALGVGGSLVLLFHVSRQVDDPAAEIRLQRFSAVIGVVPSAAIALAAAVSAHWVGSALGKPSLGHWLQELAPFAVFTTLLIIATGALEGRHRVAESIFWGEAAPNAVRIVLLPLVAALHLPETYVAHVLTLSVLLPWLWLAKRMLRRGIRGWQRWSTWDFGYCGKFTAATLFANQLGAADLVIASLLFPSAVVADYAIAARLAALFTFFQLALLKRFAPRAGRLLQTQDERGLRGEFDVCRRLTIGCTALTISGMLLLAPMVLPLLGNFTAAGPLLLLLAIPSFVQAFYATADRLLLIAGQANVALAVTATSFFILITTPFLTARWLGAAAIPAAMIMAVFTLCPIITTRAHRLLGTRVIGLGDFAWMGCGCVALAAAAVAGGSLAPVAACGALGIVGGYYLMTATARSARDDGDEALAYRAGVSAFAPVSDKASR